MKQEKLLDAIGGVAEDLLLETEQPVRRGSRTLGRIVLVAAVTAVLGITAAASAGLFSRPIGDTKIVTDETVAPFDMDSQGNIVLGGVDGMKITMEVEVDADAPAYLEDIYYIELPEGWEFDGGGSSGDRFTLGTNSTHWKYADKPGQLRLKQSVVSYYVDGTYGENCVGTLPYMPSDTKVTKQTAEMAGLQVLKVTIPAVAEFEGKDYLYCHEGETRLYWTDGKYMLEFDYPSWMTDSQAEAVLETLYQRPFIVAYPEGYGTIETETVANMKPGFGIQAGSTGTTMANSVMSQGFFAYGDGSIYYNGFGCIYAYDLETGEVKKYIGEESISASYMFTTDSYIGYVTDYDTLKLMPKDGQQSSTVYTGVHSGCLYADGMTLYATNGGTLQRIDLITGEVSALAENVKAYFVEGDYIYVLEYDSKAFLRSRKDTIDFERTELSFQPIAIYVDSEDIYLTAGGEGVAWDVIRYRDGQETKLPIRSYHYQVLDDHLIYWEKGSSVVKAYDLATGEITVLQENVNDFSILEDRYICFLCSDDGEGYWQMYDWQTGKTVSMTPENN